MSKLKEVLTRFNRNKGVIGSLICSREGMVVDSDISERFNRDAISALVSSTALTIANACKAIEFEPFSRYRLKASKGDIIISDLGKSFFVVLTGRDVNVVEINVQIYQTSNEIKKLSLIG